MKWWGSVLAMELRKILAYRSDFWVTFIGQTALQLLIATSLWKSIFETQGSTELQGYTLPMLTLYYLLVPIGTRILLGENVGFISREIYDGSFSRYLIYPLSHFQYKTVTYLTYSVFYSVQLILMYALFHFFYAETAPSLLNLFSGVALFLLGSVAFMSLAMSIEFISLWADNIWSLMVMLRFFTAFFGGGFIPLAFFPAWSLPILKWMPFPYLVALPVRTIMGITTNEEILQGIILLIAWTVIFQVVARLIWARGQKHFHGVGV